MLLGALASLPIAISTRSWARLAPPPEAIPIAQREFTDVIERYAALAFKQPDESTLDHLVVERGRELRGVLGPSGNFSKWVFVVQLARPSDDRRRVYTLLAAVASGAKPLFTNITDMAIPSEPRAVVDFLRTMQFDDAVVASGSLMIDERRGYAEGVSSPGAEFNVPTFGARFSDMTQPGWLKDAAARARSR